jgi:hypothetical protein
MERKPNSAMPQIFRPHPIYRWLTVGCLLLTGMLGWGVSQEGAVEEFFFVMLSATMSVWFGNVMLSRVQVDERAVALYSPLRGAQQIEFRQVMRITEAGRFIHTLLLLYHPRQPDGLLDLDQIRQTVLPAVINQEQLFIAIEARIPQ